MGLYDRDYMGRSTMRGRIGSTSLRRSLGGWSANTWIIVICVAIYMIDHFNVVGGVFQEWLHMSTDHAILGVQYWRFGGFQFLHADLTHLAFNMIGLYFFGPLVEQVLGGKRYLAFYLLCGIFGAILYLILNLGGILVGEDVPILLFNDTSTQLIGASAGVFGILLAGAFLAPNVKVLVLFVIPMKLSTMAYLFVALALFAVIRGSSNAG